MNLVLTSCLMSSAIGSRCLQNSHGPNSTSSGEAMDPEAVGAQSSLKVDLGSRFLVHLSCVGKRAELARGEMPYVIPTL